MWAVGFVCVCVCGCVGMCLAVCGSVPFAEGVTGFLCVMGAACVGVWVFASSVGFFRGAARLAAYVLVTHTHAHSINQDTLKAQS